MQPGDAIRIRHMIEAADTAAAFAHGRARRDLETDRMLLFALIRAIEVIGEAASRVSPELRAATPTVPWPAIVAMRNRLIHAYFDVDADMVWKTVTEELPDLLACLRPLSGDDERGS